MLVRAEDDTGPLVDDKGDGVVLDVATSLLVIVLLRAKLDDEEDVALAADVYDCTTSLVEAVSNVGEDAPPVDAMPVGVDVVPVGVVPVDVESIRLELAGLLGRSPFEEARIDVKKLEIWISVGAFVIVRRC